MPPDSPFPPPLPFFSAAVYHLPLSLPLPTLHPLRNFSLGAILALCLRLPQNIAEENYACRSEVSPATVSVLLLRLRRASNAFSASKRFGQGDFGSVYKGVLPSGEEIAVKLMEASRSLRGEREFHNELTLASRIDATCCSHVVSILGFSFDKRQRRRLILVYEYMHNGSLQDALMEYKCPGLMLWGKIFSILVSIAKGIEYLHYSCDTPILYGDIKPSNVLLITILMLKLQILG